MLSRFIRNEQGNFAILTALLILPLIFGVGAGIDLNRLHTARVHLQDLADAGSLAMAISKEQQAGKLRSIGEATIDGNRAAGALNAVEIADLKTSDKQIELSLVSTVNMTFMSIAGFDAFDVQAASIAKREVTGTVEVALVLDNTYSMIGPNTSGQKLASLKSAASKLVGTLLDGGQDQVRIALVPYADYVNVGTQYRSASWLSIEGKRAPTCRTQTTETICHRRSPTFACTVTRDGIPQSSTCGGDCLESEVVPLVPPRETCDGPDKREWFGCVGSRFAQATPPYNVTDANPSVPYPGIIDNEIKCPNPIVPLTTDRAKLLSAVNGMVVEKPYYKPLTYIPSGLMWGQNVLSASAPFQEGLDYDPKNRKPRKIVVLMTDGANTMMFQDWWGHHGPVRGGEKPDAELSSTDQRVRREERERTDSDSRKLCDYMKSKKIEIYTVAFMVDTSEGRALMAYCASTPANYFDANDSASLQTAFGNIGDSISRVRLSRD